MRIFLFGIFIGLAVALSARADDARQVFDAVYGARLKQVQTTVDRADHVALAATLLEAARSATDIELLRYMCETAYDLGTKHADGYVSAVEAMELLATKHDKRRDWAREKQIDLLTRMSRTGKTEDRDATAQRLMTLILAVGDEKVKAGRYADAVADFRRAMAVANSSKTLTPEAAKARLELAMQRDRSVKRVTALREKLLGNANDVATAEELATIYLVELNDVPAASALLTRIKDPNLKLAIEVKANPSAQLTGDAAVDLGMWYQAAAEKAKGEDKAATLSTALAFMTRAMETSDSGSSTFTKASLLAGELKKKLDALKAELAEAGKPRVVIRRGELLAEDKHDGSTGFASSANVYSLKLKAEVPVNRTILQFKGTSRGSSDGDVTIRVAGSDWVKVGGWTTDSIATARKKSDDWHTIDLATLPATMVGNEMQVKFQYRAGEIQFDIQHVKLIAR